jgi:hypothetical protein
MVGLGNSAWFGSLFVGLCACATPAAAVKAAARRMVRMVVSPIRALVERAIAARRCYQEP